MRRRTPSEIKAYGDGYAEAYKQFCHLLEKNDKDKAIRKMEIFAKGVEITVETAMDEPSSSEIPNNCEEPSDECKKCKHLKHISNYGWDCEFEFFEDCNYEPKDEPQYDFGEYADRLWKIAYERGKREALEQTEPSCDTCRLKDTTEWCKRQEVCRAYQPKDEPQTCSVNGRPYSECGSCEHFRCTADEPQTEEWYTYQDEQEYDARHGKE